MRRYLFDPCGRDGLQDRVFDSPYGNIRDLLREKNAEIHTYDMCDLSSADRVLFCNHNEQLLQNCIKVNVPKEKLYLLLFEPPSVIPRQYNSQVWNSYGKVFTWNDDLVDNKHFFKLRYPQGQSLRENLLPYSQRKFLIMVNANKYSYIRGEGYTYRRNAIYYFDNDNMFSLYGHGWNDQQKIMSAATRSLALAGLAKEPGMCCRILMRYMSDLISSKTKFSSYRGSVSDKYEVMAQYKYSLCFENQLDSPGFITEKIFDCLFAGCIPIYLGATNIQDYIPEESFIDMRKFASFAELNAYLHSIDEPTFNKLQSAGQDFIRSDRFLNWAPRGAFKEVTDVLD